MRRVLISTKPFIFVLFPVGITVRSAESLSSAIPLGTSTERANSKRANHGRSRLFQDDVSSVFFWLRSFSVCGWRTRSLSSVSGPPTRWSCVRGWLMRLLWAYEHDIVAISPFLYERIGTLCRHPCWSLWLEQRIAGWRSGRSEGYCKSLSAGHAPTDLLLLTQRTSRPVPGWHGGPGAPSLAQPGRDEGRRQGTKWSLFATWCSSCREDPRRCTFGVVLSFLQERLERRLSPSTLKVYVATIAAHHDAVDGRSLGKHDLIVRFLKGARRMNPSRPPLVPSWDLSIVLAGLQRGPFEPLDSVELKFLSLKTALLTALTSIKRVGDLQAFSVSEECLVFGPVYSHVVLPKVPTTLPRSGGEPASTALGGGRSSLSVAVSHKSIAHIRDPHPERQKLRAALCLPRRAAEREGCLQTEVGPLDSGGRSLGVPVARRAVPPGGVASFHALAHGASLADICRAAGWATPNTFARFYNLRVEPVSSRVLGK